MSSTTRQRLQALIELLLDRPKGMTTPEIAEYFGVTRQTALNDLDRLSGDGVPIFQIEGTDRYTINKTDYIKNIRLSLPQAWFLYLPLRRIVRANLHGYPLVRSLMHRMTGLIHEELGEQLLAEAEQDLSSKNDIFAELVSAWYEQRFVEIRYRPLNSSRVSQFVIAPLWFEPAVWSDGFYVIGGSRKKIDEIITLKLDRIQSLQTLVETFDRRHARNIPGWSPYKSWDN